MRINLHAHTLAALNTRTRAVVFFFFFPEFLDLAGFLLGCRGGLRWLVGWFEVGHSGSRWGGMAWARGGSQWAVVGRRGVGSQWVVGWAAG